MRAQQTSRVGQNSYRGHHLGTQCGVTVISLALGILLMIGGIFAVAACRGKLPPGCGKTISKFSKVGAINAYFLLGGGGLLTSLSLGAIVCLSSRKFV